ncbi:hypothetical protein J6590_055023 [Homalodisca vitripennis]|nr:hypothetical protein J6590_055023 [Homalodisca vitripennis]
MVIAKFPVELIHHINRSSLVAKSASELRFLNVDCIGTPKHILEALQRRFLRLIGVRLGFAYLDVSVEELSSNLNLSPLALRRDVADVVLLWKIVNGRMNCPDLLAEIDLRVPANTRSRDLLGRRYHSTNFDFNSPFARFIRLGNQVASGCDLFFDGLHQVRRQACEGLVIKTYSS